VSPAKDARNRLLDLLWRTPVTGAQRLERRDEAGFFVASIGAPR